MHAFELLALVRWGGVRRAGLRRRSLFGLVLGSWLLPGRAQDRPGGGLATLRLRNGGAAPQAADFVTPMFGQSFRRGDLPAGRYPRFALPDGTECPATLWGVTSWPDGSMKFCAAMLRVPAVLPGRGQLVVQVHAGGPAPAAGARTLAELRAAELVVELTGAAGPARQVPVAAPLEGTWRAALSDAVGTADDVVALGSGPAGAVWRIGGEVRDGKGAAHGQLYCWHYVAALSNADGSLKGLRYLGRIAQPWADVTTVPAHYRDMTAVLKAGQTVIRQLQGHADTGYPAGESADKRGYPGSEAVGDVIRLPHSASFFTAGPDARWDYVQGGGSDAADARVEVTVDVPYAQQAGLVPPFRPGPLRSRATKTVDYRPMGPGGMTRYMPSTGGRDDIGVLPVWCVRHIAEQSPDNERTVRVNALCSAGWRGRYYKRKTRRLVPTVATKPSYAGLGAPESQWRCYDQQNHGPGFVRVGPNASLWTEDTAHTPGPCYWAYLFSGEPQYLDLMAEWAFLRLTSTAPGLLTRSITFPTDTINVGRWVGDRDVRIGTEGQIYPGAGIGFSGQHSRVIAWGLRELAQAAALLPDDPPDRAATRAYLRDCLGSVYGAVTEFFARCPAGMREAGLFYTRDAPSKAGEHSYEPPWGDGYLSVSICHQSQILGTPAADAVRALFSRKWVAYGRVMDPGCFISYVMSQYDGNNHAVTSADGILFLGRRLLSFSASDSRVTIGPRERGDIGGWRPSVGDVFALPVGGFGDSSKPLPDIPPNTRLYVVNPERDSFQLSLKPGGPPVKVPADATVRSFLARLKDVDAETYFNPDMTYVPVISGAIAYHARLGDNMGDLLARLDAKARMTTVPWDGYPQFDMQAKA